MFELIDFNTFETIEIYGTVPKDGRDVKPMECHKSGFLARFKMDSK